ncbi:unnamed protein product [Cuscuta epithymum]|uniref:Uncharacterized protein n=1 Tax=Cuscuta epithymum TaxID=186058 RepID=A0AAV0CG25_9ASTE|nr:unnamed protein product [Cuscuta epithymum]
MIALVCEDNTKSEWDRKVTILDSVRSRCYKLILSFPNMISYNILYLVIDMSTIISHRHDSISREFQISSLALKTTTSLATSGLSLSHTWDSHHHAFLRNIGPS